MAKCKSYTTRKKRLKRQWLNNYNNPSLRTKIEVKLKMLKTAKI